MNLSWKRWEIVDVLYTTVFSLFVFVSKTGVYKFVIEYKSWKECRTPFGYDPIFVGYTNDRHKKRKESTQAHLRIFFYPCPAGLSVTSMLCTKFSVPWEKCQFRKNTIYAQWMSPQCDNLPTLSSVQPNKHIRSSEGLFIFPRGLWEQPF